ncbi:hypothetical protein [Streptomyces sp. NPDC050263]|uniref:hypothetical protein n=1 Tax=Streptomyces sp. NPDC050263 TaxID=3155037 RepID=UPI00341C1D11
MRAAAPKAGQHPLPARAEGLHCTAIRVTGGYPDRIETTARHAAAGGLEVWFSPFPCEMTDEQMPPYFADCAERAERPRHDGADVVRTVRPLFAGPVSYASCPLVGVDRSPFDIVGLDAFRSRLQHAPGIGRSSTTVGDS